MSHPLYWDVTSTDRYRLCRRAGGSIGRPPTAFAPSISAAVALIALMTIVSSSIALTS
jgi:hypothetical protein